MSKESPVILYHGDLSPHRGVEQLMEVLLEPGLEDVHLALMGSGEKRDDFMRASTEARWGKRVHVLEPVRPTDLLPWVASADIGAMLIQPSTLNHRLSTPNKLFECLAAGTPVVASDFPAMRNMIIDNPAGPLGAVCDPSRIDAIAAAIRSILGLERADLEVLRARCSQAAIDRWNWDQEKEGLLSAYSEISRRREYLGVRPTTT